jgi:hypothetical protein
MIKNYLQLVLGGLFALSVGTAAAVFADAAGPVDSLSCPACSDDFGCPGSTCKCKYSWVRVGGLEPAGRYVCLPGS